MQIAITPFHYYYDKILFTNKKDKDVKRDRNRFWPC